MENNENKETAILEPAPEKLYVNVTENGILRGFYSNKIHSDIPDTALEISEEIRSRIIASVKPLRIKDPTLPITADNLEEAEEEKIPIPLTKYDQLRADVDFLMIMEGYADVRENKDVF